MILADEPTGNLDTTSTQEVLAIFERLSDEGRTIVLITHEDEVAAHAAPGHPRSATGEIISDERVRWPGAGAVIETIRVAFAGLAANKLRSGLTILGLMIGVGSVIVLIAVGTGSSAAVQSQIDALGSNVLLVSTTPDPRRPARRRGRQRSPADRSPTPPRFRTASRPPTWPAPRRSSTPTA